MRFTKRMNFEIYDRVFVHIQEGYAGTVVSIILDQKNLKVNLVLTGVPDGRPCRVDSNDCELIRRRSEL